VASLLSFNHVPYNAQQKTVIRNPSSDTKNPYVRVQPADDCQSNAGEKIDRAEGGVRSCGG
ncbi:unnamed protein product, partial [Heterotrigona itama]